MGTVTALQVTLTLRILYAENTVTSRQTFEVLMTGLMKGKVFWVITLCSSKKAWDGSYSSTLKMAFSLHYMVLQSTKPYPQLRKKSYKHYIRMRLRLYKGYESLRVKNFTVNNLTRNALLCNLIHCYDHACCFHHQGRSRKHIPPKC